MEAKNKLTKEIVAQEARYILDNLVSAGQFNKEVQFEELRLLCEQSVSLRILDYVNFLERFGYLTYDRNTQRVCITADGERVVGGEKVAEMVIDVVHHFRPILSRARAAEEPSQADLGASAARMRRTAQQGSELIDDRYEKLRAIGSGGIGTVFLARQVALDRHVAVKELRELFGFFSETQRKEIMSRFTEETHKSARLFHPNIASVLDANTTCKFPYVVTEYVPGGNLRRVISAAVTIPPELGVKVFLQVLQALSHAHKNDVTHRGLKPENVLFDKSGNVRVTDFGVAKVVERDDRVIQHVYVGTGSVAYMAPELFTDPSLVGAQSDLYALGIMLYEMLARKLPGRRSPMPTKIHPSLPKVIDDIFDRLTQDDRKDRYTTAEEVLEDFHNADGAKEFLGPRGTVLFLDNPLKDVELPEEEEPEPPPAPERSGGGAAVDGSKTAVERVESSPLSTAGSGSQGLGGAKDGRLGTPSSSNLGLPSAGDLSSRPSLDTKNLDHQKKPSGIMPAVLGDPEKGLGSLAGLKPSASASSPNLPPAVPRPAAPDGAPGTGETSAPESLLDDEDLSSGDFEIGEDGTQKRRARARRPYSFQQRFKDRDNK